MGHSHIEPSYAVLNFDTLAAPVEFALNQITKIFGPLLDLLHANCILTAQYINL